MVSEAEVAGTCWAWTDAKAVKNKRNPEKQNLDFTKPFTKSPGGFEARIALWQK